MSRPKKDTTATAENAVVENAVVEDADKSEDTTATAENAANLNFPESEKVDIVSENRKSKKIIGITGTVIEFDENGKATVAGKEAMYLLTIPGIKKA